MQELITPVGNTATIPLFVDRIPHLSRLNTTEGTYQVPSQPGISTKQYPRKFSKIVHLMPFTTLKAVPAAKRLFRMSRNS